MDNKQYFNTAVSTSESIVRNVFEGLENQTPELLSIFPSIDHTYRRPGHRGYFHFGIGQTESEALQSRKLLTAGPVLSEAAKSALSAYQKSAAINDHLRGQELRGSSQNTPEVFESQSATRRFIRDLDQVTVSQKTKRQVIGYRGLRAEGEFREKFHPGQRWSEPGYSSVSTIRRISEHFMDQHLDVESGVNAERSAANSILMTVHFPKGYRASAHLVQSIPGHGTGQPEAEMLLRRGAPLRILSEEFFPGGTLRTPHTEVRAIALRFARGRLFHENTLVRRSLSNSVEPEHLYRAHVHRSIPIAPVIAAEASNPALLKEGLQQIHVNLESKIGQFFKTLWKLPFKKHSQLDPMEAAVQAYRTFQAAPSHFLSSRSQFSGQETEALSAYKGFGFSGINSALRHAPGSLSTEGQSVIQTLDELTHSGVVEREFSVHRGFRRHPLAHAAPGSLVGQEFVDPGFGSTSLNPYVVDEFARDKQGFTAEIRLKRGTKGFLLASHETWRQGDKESEFVLPRNTRYRVLEEHAAESAWRPRHLVLEAITPEHTPTPLQLGKQIAHAVRPSAGGAMATAQKMVAGETANELHTVLESGVGGFLKKLLKIPLKAHSQTDALAAAMQAMRVTTEGGVKLWKGYDASDFADRYVTNLADVELWAHGRLQGQWMARARGDINDIHAGVPVQMLVNRIAEEEGARSVLLRTCNVGGQFVSAPDNLRVIQGLGTGRGANFANSTMASWKTRGVYSWQSAVVTTQGGEARIYGRQVLRAALEARGVALPAEGGVDDRWVTLYKDATGVERLGLNTVRSDGAAKSESEFLAHSLPLSEVPYFTAQVGSSQPESFRLANGQVYGTAREASEAAVSSLRGSNLQGSTGNYVAAGSSAMEDAARSQVAAMKATAQSAASSTETVAQREISALSKEFKSKSYAGILIAGALAVGGAITMKGWKVLNRTVDADQQQNQPHGYNIPPSHNAPLHGGPEHFSIRKTFAGSPEGSTKITVDDAELDHAAVDKAFSTHLRGGLAYGRRSS